MGFLGTVGTVLIIIILILAFLGVLLAVIYNRMVTLNNRLKNAFSQIDVQLKRRYDLIPNLVSTAKAYISHEAATLEAVIQARARATSARDSTGGDPNQSLAVQNLFGAENALSGALGRLLMVTENYPDLKADKIMSDLMEDLNSTENKISYARQAYNDAVMFYNETREKFPTVLFVNLFGFHEAQHWLITDQKEAEAPKVEF